MDISSNGTSTTTAADRFSSLPDEVLLCILSLLVTKDAAAACASSKRMLFHVFPLITSLNFDDKPICHCLSQPSAIERFPTFVSFVDSVLNAHRSQFLTDFKLSVGPNGQLRYLNDGFIVHKCKAGCCPHLNSAQINTWIAFASTRIGLRELNLRIIVRNECDVELPPEIFTHETLQVLKLGINLGLNQASSSSTTFRLPNLKLLQLFAAVIPEDSFLTKLVSSCPLLEDLEVIGLWDHARSICISSSSLLRLTLLKLDKDDEDGEDEVSHPPGYEVVIDTPNLKSFTYEDRLASNYSITNMDCLVEAYLEILSYRASCQSLLSLIIPISSNVERLTIHGSCTQDINSDELRDQQLPVFRNLKHLELYYNPMYKCCWDKVVFEFLNCSPVLETLVFPCGLDAYVGDSGYNEGIELERRFDGATTPECCMYHLRKIEIEVLACTERGLHLVQPLLRHALVLEELIFQYASSRYGLTEDQVKLTEKTLQGLPRASSACSIVFRNNYPT